ncbi:MAG: O-antigen ligase family protein, partial [Bacteroidota bacterium]
SFLLHPISLLLLLHVFWIYLTTLSSNLFFVSLKFSLAKTWYLVVFYFLAAYLLKDLKQQKLFFWLLSMPLLFTVVVTMIRHAGYGFSFVGIHKVLHPFQRNHVNYAAMLAYVLPLVWFTWHRFPKWSKVWWFLLGSIALMVVAVYLSFTRAAYLALVIAVGTYFIFKWKLIRYALLAAFIALVIGAFYVVQNNRYLDYAPNYDRTVTHYEFDNLVEATYNLEDISTMERLYRWVAALNMSPEEPWVGFGPGNFVNFYESYTLNAFRTYVSHNPERSGIHNYFLMILVDQGIIGLLLFLLFSVFLFIKGEKIYHQTQDSARKGVVMACLLALVVIYAFLIINDLLETDKVGSIYLVCIAILVNTDLYNQRQLQAAQLKAKVDTSKS